MGKCLFETKFPKTKQVAIRTAIVLGENGGAYPIMSKLARFGLCTSQGDGNQWVSWISVQDFCRAIDFILEKEVEGVVNLCSPNYISNKKFNRLLAKKYKPVIRIPQPEWLLRIGAAIIGTESELILKSRKVYPERLLNLGFQFNDLTVEGFLENN